jgi:hypothetical protein
LTPIILFNEYPEVLGRRKVKYISGKFQERQVLPESVSSLNGGIVIDMPDTGCEQYLRTVIDIDKLLPDEELIQNLEDLIEDHKFQRRLRRLREKDPNESELLDAQSIVDLPLFKDLTSQKREVIKKKFQHIFDRSSAKDVVKGSHLDQLQY